MRITLGLFHFNVQWSAGDLASYHRYVREALIPFLEVLRRNPWLRVSVEMAGSGLEFVSAFYPGAIRILKSLIFNGQIELISSLYTPNLWVAFPKEDLLRSIVLNRRCLQQLGLEASRTFFAQECLFGHGVAGLTEFFDTAICKDDYLTHFYDVEVQPMYQLGDMLVVVASNHLLNELSRRVFDEPSISLPYVAPAHLEHLQYARRVNAGRTFPGRTGCFGDLRWEWVHCGDGNHVTTWRAPNDWKRCFADPPWIALVEWLFHEYLNAGMEFHTVSEFVRLLEHYPPAPMPVPIEGGWDSGRSGGVYQWMGKHESEWEQDDGILCYASRSRRQLIRCEECLGLHISGTAGSEKISELLLDGWRHQLFAEASDSLGWFPSAEEVAFAVQAAEQVRALCSSALALRPEPDFGDRSIIYDVKRIPTDDVFLPHIVGGDHRVRSAEIEASCTVIDIWMKASSPRVAVWFPLEGKRLVYCPSAQEQDPVSVDLDTIRRPSIHLPLANGLIRLTESSYLIKDTAFVHVAAHIDRDEGTIEFASEGVSLGEEFVWRFYIYAGEIEDAVVFANMVNWCRHITSDVISAQWGGDGTDVCGSANAEDRRSTERASR